MKKTFLNLILVVIICGFGCGELTEEDDDNNEENYPPDPNGWDTDGCSWGFPGSQGEEKAFRRSLKDQADWEDCLPPKPLYADNDAYNKLADILDLYLGEYADQNDNRYTIECFPDGYWVIPHYLPNTRCGYNWVVPVRVRLSGGAIQYDGLIYQDYPYINEQEASLRFGQGETWYWADKKYLNHGRWQWLFSSAEGNISGGMIWVKVQ